MREDDTTKIAVCPDCGESWIEEDLFCRFCGAKKGSAKYVRPNFACIYGPMPEDRTHICQKCGYTWTTQQMVDNQAYCPQCGGDAPICAIAPICDIAPQYCDIEGWDPEDWE